MNVFHNFCHVRSITTTKISPRITRKIIYFSQWNWFILVVHTKFLRNPGINQFHEKKFFGLRWFVNSERFWHTSFLQKVASSNFLSFSSFMHLSKGEKSSTFFASINSKIFTIMLKENFLKKQLHPACMHKDTTLINSILYRDILPLFGPTSIIKKC